MNNIDRIKTVTEGIIGAEGDREQELRDKQAADKLNDLQRQELKAIQKQKRTSGDRKP